jgi:hypothetical protein
MSYPQHKVLGEFKKIILSDLALHWFFSKYDVYFSSSCSSNFLSKDCGFHSKKSLRKSWVYGNTGFLSQMNLYYSFESRINEFSMVRDSPDSLRQKLNILHIMNECDFEPNNPIHISVFDSHDKTKNILNLDDEETWDNFRMAIHPGHTRVIGSVFLNSEIKSNLLYVKKKNGTVIKGNNVKKLNINNFKEHFIDKFSKDKIQSKIYKGFCWPENDYLLKDSFKKTTEEEDPIQILKLYYFLEYDKKDLKSKSIGNLYIYDTFIYSNAYFKILYNNKLNIYSTNREDTINLFFTNLINLHDSSIPIYEIKQTYGDFIKNNLYKSEAMLTGLSESNKIFDKNEKNLIDKFNNFYKDIQLSKKPKDIIDKNIIFDKRYYYSINKNNETFYNIVEKNNFKGFAIFVDNTKIDLGNFDRTLPELLYIANPTVSIVRSVNNEFAIINCEDEYWKTNQNYKEIVIQKSFYEN